MASEKVLKLIEEVEALTVLELSELVKELEEKFGVSAAAPVAVAAAPVAGATAAAEEKTEFNVILKEAGAEKIKVINDPKQTNIPKGKLFNASSLNGSLNILASHMKNLSIKTQQRAQSKANSAPKFSL